LRDPATKLKRAEPFDAGPAGNAIRRPGPKGFAGAVHRLSVHRLYVVCDIFATANRRHEAVTFWRMSVRNAAAAAPGVPS